MQETARKRVFQHHARMRERFTNHQLRPGWHADVTHPLYKTSGFVNVSLAHAQTHTRTTPSTTLPIALASRGKRGKPTPNRPRAYPEVTPRRLPYVLQEKRCVLKRCAGELLIGWQVSVRSRKGSLGGCRWVCESENAKTRPASRIFEPYQLAQATSAASSAAVAAQNIMPQAAGANVPMDANMSAADVFCRTSAKPIDETDLKRSWENYVGRLMTP